MLVPNINTTIPTFAVSSQRSANIARLQRFFFRPVNIAAKIFRTDRISSQPVISISPDISYVIASNHQSRIDPFIVCSQLPRELWLHLLPCRYFAHNGLFKNPILRFFIVSFGSFPIWEFRGSSSGLDFATTCLQNNQTVFIFPEGRRSLPGESIARRGVATLAQLPNVEILPCHIEWRRNSFALRTFRLTFGQPFDGSNMTAQEILDYCYALPLR